MKKWLKFSLSSLLIVILLISVAACNNNTDPKKLQKVRLAEVTRSIFYAPEYVALAKGFLKKKAWTLN